MKIRILSDLHIDINSRYPLELVDNNIFTIVAGDISGLTSVSADWIDKNIKKGLFIAGNHIVYNHSIKTLEEFKKELSQKYPLTNDVTFLDTLTNTYYREINGIIFIGTTLYTNYKLGKRTIKQNMNIGFQYLNDFKYGKTFHNGKIDCLNPKDYKKWFKDSMKKITNVVEDNPDREIVIITHHCPSEKCIDTKYKDSIANASYASNLEDFIIKHPNIKCWICGHVHNRKIFKIGKCLIIQNPRGYERSLECNDFNPNFYLDTDKWGCYTEPYNNEQWITQREEDDKVYNKLFKMGFF